MWGADLCKQGEMCLSLFKSSRWLGKLDDFQGLLFIYLFPPGFLDAVEAPVPLTVCTDVRALLSDSPQANDDK